MAQKTQELPASTTAPRPSNLHDASSREGATTGRASGVPRKSHAKKTVDASEAGARKSPPATTDQPAEASIRPVEQGPLRVRTRLPVVSQVAPVSQRAAARPRLAAAK